VKKKIEMQDAIWLKNAMKMAGVADITLRRWIQDTVLERYEIAGHPIFSKTELLFILEEKRKNPLKWKHEWLKHKAQLAREYPQGKG
jgi:hypothetical protein